MPDHNKSKKSENDKYELQEVARKQFEAYERAKDAGHEDYMEIAKRCDRFYRGQQWDQADISALDDQGRPALTINTILPTINTVLGEQSTRRADIKFKPRSSGIQETADALTKVFLQISENNNLHWLESQVFADGLIQDRGYFDVRLDFSDSLMGEVRITAKDPLDILIDPDAKEYDPRSWNEIFETKWMSLEDIEEQYGEEYADQLRIIGEGGNSYGPDSMEYHEQRYGDTENMYSTTFTNNPEENKSIRSIRVIERQHYKMKECMFYVDPITGDQRSVPYEWSKEKTEQFADQFGLHIMKKRVRKVRWTVTADRVVLHDDWSPYDEFTIVPYFPYFRRGRPFGMVRNLISPQEQLNKITSQELHIVNTTANSGWIVESGSLSGMTVDDLEEHGAETGLVLEYNRGSTPPGKIPPNQIPTGLDRISQKSAMHIKQISGVSDSMLGTDGPEVSGIAIKAKQNRGVLMIQVPLDNLTKTRHYLAEKILHIVQRYYSEERIIHITDEADPFKASIPVRVNEISPEGRIVNDLTLGEYDVVVDTMPARDNFDEVQFAEAIELRTVGVPIPDDMIVEYSHLARKADIAQRIRALQGLEPPTPEQQQLQAFQMETQIRSAQLEIAKMEAEVQRTQSEAQLNAAKAQSEAADPQVKIAELQNKIQIKREELALRERLSAMTNDMRKNQSDTAAAAKLATAAIKPPNR